MNMQQLTMEEYLSIPAVNKSLLDAVAKSPAHAKAMIDGYEKHPSDEMSFGTALHYAILEPDLFQNRYATFSGDRRFKEHKVAYAELQRMGKVIIDAEEMAALKGIQTTLMHEASGSQFVRRMLGGLKERTFLWDGDYGLKCKCKPDAIHEDLAAVIDIKTTTDGSREGFQRSLRRYRYHVQAAHYLEGTHFQNWEFWVFEKEPPYTMTRVRLDSDYLEIGRKLRDQNMADLASCFEFDSWPGYNEGKPIMLSPDKWEF